MTEFRSGFVCFVGRPNTGKSTLTNALVGAKVAITSNRPQTTRHTIRGIVHRENFQIILVDTPGRPDRRWECGPASGDRVTLQRRAPLRGVFAGHHLRPIHGAQVQRERTFVNGHPEIRRTGVTMRGRFAGVVGVRVHAPRLAPAPLPARESRLAHLYSFMGIADAR